jgi:uncharacterized phage-associated protein
MSFPAKAVANEFLRIARENSEALTAMKLQKLVFFAHGWTLALTGNPLISDPIEAWEFGPVIPALYHEFKRFGNEPITEPAREGTFRGLKFGTFVPTLDDYESNSSRSTARQVLSKIWEKYSGFSAARLSNATHEKGSPWAEVYDPDKLHIRIPDPLIKKYFEGLIHGK